MGGYSLANPSFSQIVFNLTIPLSQILKELKKYNKMVLELENFN